MTKPTRSAPEERFSDRVENYVRFRPRYPEAAIEWLRSETGLASDAVIADVGSGTGISAEPFLQLGCTVFCVEPNANMRGAAERLLSSHRGFKSINGTAEATTLENRSVDFVVAAQAFHWFDPQRARAEFTRILKPAGWTVLMWNVRRVDSTPFLSAYEKLLLTHATDYAQVRHENVGDAELNRFFTKGACTSHSVAHEQHFDFEGLKGRLLSSSYAPAEGHPGHQPMLDALTRIFNQYQLNGHVAFEYDTQMHIGR
jgi:SAM-dependent methyltransferase